MEVSEPEVLSESRSLVQIGLQHGQNSVSEIAVENKQNHDGNKMMLQTFAVPPRKIQNKVIKGKMTSLEHCAGITGFLSPKVNEEH
jgi:hypothetical protein